MAYTHFYHKNGQRNNSESPDPNTGFASNNPVDEIGNEKTGINLMAAGVVLGTQGVRVINKVIDASGNSILKKRFSTGLKVAGFGLLFLAGGLPGLAVAAVAGIANVVMNQIDEFEKQENDRYMQKLTGERTNKYNKGGEYND